MEYTFEQYVDEFQSRLVKISKRYRCYKCGHISKRHLFGGDCEGWWCNVKVDLARNESVKIEDQVIIDTWVTMYINHYVLNLTLRDFLVQIWEFVPITEADTIIELTTTLWKELSVYERDFSLTILNIYIIFKLTQVSLDHFIRFFYWGRCGYQKLHKVFLSIIKDAREFNNKTRVKEVKEKWEMENDDFDSYIQWLPRETTQDTTKLIF